MNSPSPLSAPKAPFRLKNYALPAAVVAVELFVRFGPSLMAAVGTMDDLNTNPTSDTAFGKIWENVSLGWKVFQAVMMLTGGVFVYLGMAKIKKKDWGEVLGFVGSGLGIALGPGIYKWITARAAAM